MSHRRRGRHRSRRHQSRRSRSRSRRRQRKLEKECDALEEDLDNARTELETTQQNLTTLQEENQKAKIAHRRLESELADLKLKQASAAQDKARQRQEHEAYLKLQQECEKFAGELRQLKANQAPAIGLQIEIEKLKKSLEDQTKARDEAERQCKKLMSQSENHDACNEKIAELRQKLDAKSADPPLKIKTKLRAVNGKKANLEFNRKQTVESLKAKQRKDMQAVKQRLTRVALDKKRLQKRVEYLEREMKSADEETPMEIAAVRSNESNR